MHTLFAVFKAFGAIVCILGLLVGFGWAMEWRRRRRFDRAGFAAFVQSGALLKHEEFISAFGKAPFTKEHTIVSTHSAGTILFGTQGASVGDPAFKESFALTLDQTIPAGEYPINVLIGRRDDGDQRCMGMQVTFSSASEQILKPAWPKSEKGRWLKSRQLPHFGVDSATAGVFSVDVADKIAALPREQLMEGRTEVNPYLSKNEKSLWMRVTI